MVQHLHPHAPDGLSTLSITTNDDGRIVYVMLNRETRMNALSAALLGELVTVSRWLVTCDEVRVVVLHGAGNHFTAGFDLDDFSGPSTADPRTNADLGRHAAEALSNVPQLTIAAVRGHCIGGGVVLTACCDLRIAADNTVFRIPEVDLGIPLAWGGVPRLVREIGPAMARELILTCRPFDASEAQQLGFVNRVVPVADLDDEVATLASSMAAKPAFAVRTTKAQVAAVTEEIAGTGRNANDADTLVVAMRDPESRAISQAYLAARGRRDDRPT